MKPNQIEQTSDLALKFTLNGELKKAIDTTRLLTDELQWGDITDRLSDIHENYRLMLRYFMQGVDDPERKRIFNKLAAKLLQLNILLREELLVRNTTAFEYTQKRYYPHKLHFSSSSDLFDSLKYYHNKKRQAIEDGVALSDTESVRIRQNYERLLPDLFMTFWLMTAMGQAERTVYKQLMLPEYPGITEKCLVISALTMNLWRMFDEEKLMLLIEACENDNSMIRQRALVGLCFVLVRYNNFLPYFPSVRNRLMLMADNNRILDNLINIVLLIAGSSDTDRITRKMKEEILPEMMKLSPMIKNKLESESQSKPDEWSEENPEWNEMLEQSGLGEKLQELTNLQLEGADVYMSTFAVLKNFSFFNEISNWFMPFDPEFSSISELFGNNDQSLMTAFLNNSVICNSDKYSFSLSVMQMPATQREMMSHSFKAEADQLAEITRDESLLKPNLADKNIARQYIQDLYRFFRLHPQHSEFQDMFAHSLKIHESAFFDILAAAGDLKEQLAEYCFSKSFYEPAIDLYNELIKGSEPSAALNQKLGFSYQKLGNIDLALAAYLKADLIQPDDLWTVRKIAMCYRTKGNYEKALEHYRHVDFLKPGVLSTRMQLAKCLIALENYTDALQLYAQLEKSYPDELKVWRATGWCAFIAGNLHQAEFYLEKVISSVPNAVDYLNAGHIALCLKKRIEAIDFYKKSLALQTSGTELLAAQLEADRIYLLKNGLTLDEIRLFLDAYTYSLT
jgi:tetratricopeptide (TPR) repeat protein